MDVRIDVRLACLGRRNTCPRGKPLARDLLYDQRGGVAAPLRVCVPVEGEAGEPLPGYTLRHARMWLSAGDGWGMPPPAGCLPAPSHSVPYIHSHILCKLTDCSRL